MKQLRLPRSIRAGLAVVPGVQQDCLTQSGGCAAHLHLARSQQKGTHPFGIVAHHRRGRVVRIASVAMVGAAQPRNLHGPGQCDAPIGRGLHKVRLNPAPAALRILLVGARQITQPHSLRQRVRKHARC